MIRTACSALALSAVLIGTPALAQPASAPAAAPPAALPTPTPPGCEPASPVTGSRLRSRCAVSLFEVIAVLLTGTPGMPAGGAVTLAQRRLTARRREVIA